MVRAVERAHAIGADALQVFIDNPAAWKRRAEPPAELPAFRERLAALGIGPIAVHASYLVNLAGPSEDLFERSVALLAHELAAAPDYGARFVNVHVGSHKGAGVAAGIARVADGVARVLAMADEGVGRVGGRVARDAAAPRAGELRRQRGRDRDEPRGARGDLRGCGRARRARPDASAFAWTRRTSGARGTTWRPPRASTPSWMSWPPGSGSSASSMVHLNDSKATRGSRLDRHEHLGAGEMGAGAGLARLLTHPALAHVAYFLETPGMDQGYDAVNMGRARALAAGEPLDSLPPEAFHLHGARSRTPAA